MRLLVRERPPTPRTSSDSQALPSCPAPGKFGGIQAGRRDKYVSLAEIPRAVLSEAQRSPCLELPTPKGSDAFVHVAESLRDVVG